MAGRLDQLLTTKYPYAFDLLIEHAGVAVCEAAVLAAAQLNATRVLVLAGPGYNGADGYCAARLLAQHGFPTTVLSLKQPDNPVIVRLAQLCNVFKVSLTDDITRLEEELGKAELIIDAIFGFSFKGEPRSPYKEVIARLNAVQDRVLSVDVPSGWDPDG